MQKTLVTALISGCALVSGADWLTDGGNPQRTAWQKDEKILTTANVAGMKLLWKLKLDNQPRAMHSLFPPLIVARLNTPSGPRQVAIEAGSSDNIYAIDVEKGEVIWQKHFESSWTPPANGRGGPGVLCPGGQTATPVIGPASTTGNYTIYAASSDGMLHQLNAADGEDLAPPSKWMPPNGKPYALNLLNNVLYTHTAEGCSGNPNVVYSFDLATNKVGTWGPAGGGMWGRTGPAISANGTMYTGTGDGQWDPANGVYGSGFIGVKQDPRTKALVLADFYGPSNAEWLVKRDLDIEATPAIFIYKGRELMVDAGKECRIYLMDTKSIGGNDHRTPLYRSAQICNEDFNSASAGIWGSMATWEDAQGTRWVLTPIWGPPHSAFKAPLEYEEVNDGAIVAFRLEEKDGKLTLVPAWMSQNMNRAEPPVVANGIVFAYGNGEDTTQSYPDIGIADTPERRIAGSSHAILYALDAETGKTLWSSRNQIASWNHWSGLSVANGRVYIGTYDSNLYCFGLR